jgi:hypothetical protein
MMSRIASGFIKRFVNHREMRSQFHGSETFKDTFPSRMTRIVSM